jgi:polar amino acid transport system substrate-binding protein
MNHTWKKNLFTMGMALASTLALTSYAQSAPKADQSAPAASAKNNAYAVPKSPTIDRIKARGTLKVGVLSQLPWVGENPANPKQPWYGPTWMQAEKVATALGVKLVAVPVSHDTKVTAVQTGQVDMTIAPLDVTDARKKVNTVATNSVEGPCIVALKSKTKIRNLDDLKKPGIKVAIPLGGSQQQLIPTEYPQMKIMPQMLLPGVNWATASTLNGTTDVTIFPSAQVYLLLKAYSDKFDVIPEPEKCLAHPLLPIAAGWGIQKGDPAFVTFVQGILDASQPAFDEQFIKIAKELGK